MNYLTILIFMLLSFVGTSVAFAQSEGLAELAKPVLDAVLSGQYVYAAALALVLGVALLRRYGGSRWPLLASRKAAPFLVLVGSLAAALATGISAGSTLTATTLWAAVKVAVSAAGGYSLLKAVLKPLEDRAPAWLSPVFVVAGLIFRSKEGATKAGQKAVDDDPSKGTDVEWADVE